MSVCNSGVSNLGNMEKFIETQGRLISDEATKISFKDNKIEVFGIFESFRRDY